jgi:hypothetical protein
MTSESARTRAEESIAASFTRVMNATTSRWGMLTDPSIVGAATAPGVIALLAAIRMEAAQTVVIVLEVLAALPLTIAVVLALSLRGARARVIDWLAGLPFPVENLNALLNGLGESLEVTFKDAAPSAKELNAELDRVSPDSFVSKSVEDGEKPADEKVVEVRIGVVDTPRNPSVGNHRRFLRVRALVSDVLVPLSARFPIAEIRVK